MQDRVSWMYTQGGTQHVSGGGVHSTQQRHVHTTQQHIPPSLQMQAQVAARLWSLPCVDSVEQEVLVHPAVSPVDIVCHHHASTVMPYPDDIDSKTNKTSSDSIRGDCLVQAKQHQPKHSQPSHKHTVIVEVDGALHFFLNAPQVPNGPTVLKRWLLHAGLLGYTGYRGRVVSLQSAAWHACGGNVVQETELLTELLLRQGEDGLVYWL